MQQAVAPGTRSRTTLPLKTASGYLLGNSVGGAAVVGAAGAAGGGNMVRRLFGTDGIRGTGQSAADDRGDGLALGLGGGGGFTRGDHRNRVVIGKDTRLSGYMLEPALTAGFIAMGMDVTLLGPLPTPGVAMLTRPLRADLGVMISASHNPYYDNGLRCSARTATSCPTRSSWPSRKECAGRRSRLGEPRSTGPRGPPRGRARPVHGSAQGESGAWGMTLEGLKIVIDCANGAAYGVAPRCWSSAPR